MNGEAAAPDGQRKRVAVFASFSPNGLLPPQVLPYLAGLKPLTEAIVVVCDNDLLPEERARLAPFARHVITGRHGEYDFGSYKRGFAWASENGLLDDADDLILCNDSCFGPVGSFAPMFARMEARGLDFWGATDSMEFSYHLQSYFVVLSRAVFRSPAFRRFVAGITRLEGTRAVIMQYELGLTKTLRDAGFTAGAMVENRRAESAHSSDPTFLNVTKNPLYALTNGLPLVKVKALRVPEMNLDGPNRVLAWLKVNAAELYEVATFEFDVRQFEQADQVAFSLILPTYDRARCVVRAIASAMAQTHANFELIVVDDGSTDGTEALVAREFGDELARGRLRYVRLPENGGVSRARNVGLAYARNPWIAYLDSDNELRPYFLTMMANAIVQYRGRDAFYGRIIKKTTGKVVGEPFSSEKLHLHNYIDLGAFVHRKSLVDQLGGFDPKMRRLVDWDLITRYTRHREPLFLPWVFLDYSDDGFDDRISNRENHLKALLSLRSKHGSRPTISTIIPCYNHQDHIAEAIESALAQTGDYEHEILLSDDGSTDETPRIVADYAARYPHLIRDISRGGNFGLSENYRHCFREAAGNFVAVLEGDDYWTDPEKNAKQAEFLLRHRNAMLVFSRVELLDAINGHRRLLKRQDGLRPLLTGADFAGNEHLDLIANLSSTMIRRVVAAELPAILYEPRFNRITLPFYLDRLGKLGFIDGVMGVHRFNAASARTGASDVSRLEQAIAVRESALHVARAEYHSPIRQRLQQKQRELRDLVARPSPLPPAISGTMAATPPREPGERSEPRPVRSDHALVVHLWHLDTMDDLAAHARNFPTGSDQFVTYAQDLPLAAQRAIAKRFPAARLVPVRNVGQDVGALFQLMEKVDLGRYDFICKIHSKRGPTMPDEWRAALLKGVLGSPGQVEKVVRGFREDPGIQLAGALQLFLHGPTHLWRNAAIIDALFQPVLNGFDFRRSDWGFVAGTCFWIRTGIVEALRGCFNDFREADYAEDATPAHALERMFGMMVALSGGKVMLSDVSWPDPPIEIATGLPPDLPRRFLSIVMRLRTLQANTARIARMQQMPAAAATLA